MTLKIIEIYKKVKEEVLRELEEKKKSKTLKTLGERLEADYDSKKK